ncbi:NACHT domain-containing protein [Leeuwenhoekiella aestuarii]|uniref:NACHT domain-containing protein n=1 Tax=Leeuwenhoekiella aestuarii TaxID=2249426 RepID=A0A4Q0NUE4_9FLAO|nr:hypothetical protein [Leeuwenhoekiella aestuarii]RXG15245.1 hypothetical protein DSM04_103133 [Leeuwenhoekiella aestuarii]
MKKEHYEIRYINKTNESTNELSILGIDNKVLLVDEIFVQQKIVLLGNPGIGKTTELKHLFNVLWAKKNETGLIPFYIDLKYFRRTNRFEDLILYDEWKNLPNVVFILDGLDEIEYLHDFISEFEIFTTRYSDRKIKYVVSCRTNIYEKHLINISGFQTYYLKNLNFDQAKSILKKKYSLDINSLRINEKSKEFIQSPFFLSLFVEYFKQAGELPSTDSEIWDLYINATINRHKTKYIKKGLIQKPVLINRLEKLAFVNELMQRNYISDKNLYEMFNNEYEEFTSNPPLLVYNSEQENWSFEHRQIQEFFVAKVLLDKSIEEILEIVKIKNINAIHPSLFNAITFLLNLFDEENPTYNELINWLKENQIEILFKADSDRVSKKIRIAIFQEYFIKECIEKTLWISTRRTFDVSEIADFGNCKENFDFLLSIINDYKKYHFRTLYSAIELMNFFSKSSYSKKELKKYLLEYLNTKDFPIRAKSQILRLIQKHGLVGPDKKFLDSIYKLFEKETNKQLNNSLLVLIADEDDIDKYYEFIKHEYLLVNNIKERAVPDEVHRGNRFILDKIILALKDSNNFIDIISYYFNNEISSSYANDFETGLVEKCAYFIKVEPSFLINLLSMTKDNFRFLRHDSVIKEIITETNKEKEAIHYLISNTDAGDSRYFISQFIKEDNISDLVSLLLKKNISHQEIEFYRNNISNSGKRKLAVLFNNLMEDRGVIFKEPVVSEEKYIQFQEDYKKYTQDNFDILFDEKRLIKNIEGIFKQNNDQLTRERLNELRRDWYNQNGHGNEIDASLSILDNLSFFLNENVLSFSEVKKTIQKDNFIIVDRIRRTIEKYQNNGRKLVISDKQKEFIRKWSLSSVENTDFDAIAKPSGPTSFYFVKNHYKIFGAIFYFQRIFGFELPQDFLLKSIEFYELDKSGVLDDSFYYLKELIGNDELFEKQIVHNINERELLGLSKLKHFEYALKYNLKDSFQSIREYLLTGESFFNEKNKLEDYVIKANDKEILPELCFDEESYIYWSSIHLMLKLDFEKEFCIQKALEYLESKKERFRTDAFAILVEQNHPKAYNFMMEALVVNKPYPMHSIKFSHFNEIKSFTDLAKIYNLIYNEKLDQFESSYYKEFYRSLIMNLSARETIFNHVQEVLLEIKKSLEKNKADLFYINLLIDDSKGAYISSKSTPFTFIEAKKVALEFIE